MSITEMKLKAIEKIKSLNNEETLKNILNELEKSEDKSEIKVYNLSRHFESISKRYDETLKKLAK
jgi:chaperonin cofactor prefoldin